MKNRSAELSRKVWVGVVSKVLLLTIQYVNISKLKSKMGIDVMINEYLASSSIY